MHIHSRIGPTKPAPHRMARGAARVVVRSLGGSSVGLARSLLRMVPLPEPDIAALLLQAPSELLTGLDRCSAEMIVSSLRESGLDCAVLDGDAVMEEGVGDHEVALNVHDFTRMPSLVREVMFLLGIDERSARQLVCAVPAVLLAGVSRPNVQALRSRFAPLGACIDASCPKTARFDLFLGHCTPALRERALARLHAVVGESLASSDTAGGVLTNIDRDTVDRAWLELRQLAVPIRVVNRDFARYALLLQQGADTPELRRCLTELGVTPECLPAPPLRHPPMVLQHGLRHSQAAARLAALQAAGARATVEPLALQHFSLTLDPVRDLTPLLSIVGELGMLKEAEVMEILRSPIPRLPGPFTTTQARWLAHELRRAGISVQLEVVT
jgi:hypothetical protein